MNFKSDFHFIDYSSLAFAIAVKRLSRVDSSKFSGNSFEFNSSKAKESI